MRVGILCTAAGLALAAAANAATSQVAAGLEDRSLEAMHRAIGAPGSATRAETIRDLQKRVMRGEVSPFTVLLDEALPTYIRDAFGPEAPMNAPVSGQYTYKFDPASRGTVVSFVDDFSSYNRSDDPVFDRFGVGIGGQLTPPPHGQAAWFSTQAWYIPTLFNAPGGVVPIDGGTGLPDPLPRWQGAVMTQTTASSILVGDINGDCIVNTADLGLLIGAFGSTQPPFTGPNLNGDTVVNTADLGLLLGNFNDTCPAFCLFTVDEVQTTDPGSVPLDPSTITAGPDAGNIIAVVKSSAWTNDANADDCPDCDFFNIDPTGGLAGERVYGTWTLTNPNSATTGGAQFIGARDNDTCVGWGNNAVLADARGEDQSLLQAGVCCFFGARQPITSLFTATGGLRGTTIPLNMDIDFYLTSISSFQWIDSTSSVEGFTVTRVFMGGYSQALDEGFIVYDSDNDGYMDAFVVLGNLPGNFQFGQFFGTIDDPNTPGTQGKQTLVGEWCTLRFVSLGNEIQIWLHDSETQTLVDPDGTDGSGTPTNGADDIYTEGSKQFAKIFPTGPYGVCIGDDGELQAEVPQPTLAAVSCNQRRYLWGGDPTPAQDPNYIITSSFYDNVVISGVLFETPELPKFALNYCDDIESYNLGQQLALQGGRWFDALSSRAIISNALASSGNQSIVQENQFADGAFRNEFDSNLPFSAAQGAGTVIAEVDVAFTNTTCVRGIRLEDNTFSLGIDNILTARLLSGVQDPTGLVVVDGMGFSRFHVRTRNPNFNDAMEPETDGIEIDASDDPAVSGNPVGNQEFINVPTNRLLNVVNTFLNVAFEVEADRDLIVRVNGVAITPDAILAPNVGYGLAGWDSESTGVDEIGFESGNQPFAQFVALFVDDVKLTGAEPIEVDGPAYELPYVDNFALYPVDAPISGQGDTPFINAASIPDTFLCIEQGAQALNLTTNDNDTWCVYQICPDGIAAVNDYGLAPGNSIFVRQADCGGAVPCKVLEKFTNPNRPTEIIPNVALVDPAEVKATEGAQVLNMGTFTGTPAGSMNCFEFDAYDPASIFCRYEVDSIDEVGTASIIANDDYYNNIIGKLQVGDIIAVDQLFEIDPMSGESDCPGVVASAAFKVVDPCGVSVIEGTWTRVAEFADPLDCADVPHFNYTATIFPRWTGGLGGEILVVDDPTASGRGNVLCTTNNGGFTEDDSIFISLRSVLPDADADDGSAVVVSYEIWVQDFNSRFVVQHDGSEGGITDIMFGGPDNIATDNPGGVAYAAANTFRLLERNPGFGGPFSMGPEFYFVDSGEVIPAQTWLTMVLTISPGGNYTYTFNATPITTPPAGANGEPITIGADLIDGFDTNQAFDLGGDGSFNRDPIEIMEDNTLPGANAFPDDFCFYLIDDIIGTSPMGDPAPCNGVSDIDIGDVVGVLKNTGLPNWPNGGNFDVCPVSADWVWRPTGSACAGVSCTGPWNWLDPNDPADGANYPGAVGDVAEWATYCVIPPYGQPQPASVWYIDNLNISVTP